MEGNGNRNSERWAFVDVDAIYCINLKEATDRWQYCLEEFERVGLRTVQFHRVDRDPRGGRYGCFASHLDIVRKAYNEGKDRVLIFEDDIRFEESWQTVVSQCSQFIIRSAVPWDALFFGSSIHYLQGDVDPELNIVKCNVTKTHCLCISRQGMKSFLDNADAMDLALKRLTHDRALNYVWNDIYAHFNCDVVAQNLDFDSANIWVDTGVVWMDEWLTNRIMPVAQRKFLPFEKILLRRGHCSFGEPQDICIDNKIVTVRSSPTMALLQVVVGVGTMFQDDKVKFLKALPILPLTIIRVFTNKEETVA